jgi:hypothetical protein
MIIVLLPAYHSGNLAKNSLSSKVSSWGRVWWGVATKKINFCRKICLHQKKDWKDIPKY